MEFHGSCKRLFQVCFHLHLLFWEKKILLKPAVLSIFQSSVHHLRVLPSLLPFQEDGLRQIFMLTMEVLQEFSRRENLNAQMSSVFQRYLALANQVLSWNFLPPNYILFLVVTPNKIYNF